MQYYRHCKIFTTFTGPRRFGLNFADLKYDYTQEFYRFCKFFISKSLRTGKFCCVCITHDVTTENVGYRSDYELTADTP